MKQSADTTGSATSTGGKQATSSPSANRPAASSAADSPVATAVSATSPAVSTEEEGAAPGEAIAVHTPTSAPSSVDIVLDDPDLLAPALDEPSAGQPLVEEHDTPAVVALPQTTPLPDPSTPAGRRAARLALLQARRLQREALRSSNQAIRARLHSGLEPAAFPSILLTWSGPGTV